MIIISGPYQTLASRPSVQCSKDYRKGIEVGEKKREREREREREGI
jgi:hypothetical protein